MTIDDDMAWIETYGNDYDYFHVNYGDLQTNTKMSLLQ